MQTHYNIRHYYLKHWQETLLTDPWGHDMGCLYICHTNPTMHQYTGIFYTGLLWIPIPVNVLFVSLHCCHYNDVIMSTMATQITSLTIVYSTIYSGTNQRKHQSSTSLAFVRGIHWSPVNSPHKGLVTRKMFSFDDAIMNRCGLILYPLSEIRNQKSFIQ